ncbi:hypothetical protein Pmani_034538 [Petrolisthes manimaculis]|uniref:Uncharacterized protein n=1 Tax=Petrolisthes manimaculis TaxID=1843537 RepID=A0AAE1NMB3_9EUCA|nr:hypothetical protein Pmani_034538 [Petrolisthes manimaculis]
MDVQLSNTVLHNHIKSFINLLVQYKVETTGWSDATLLRILESHERCSTTIQTSDGIAKGGQMVGVSYVNTNTLYNRSLRLQHTPSRRRTLIVMFKCIKESGKCLQYTWPHSYKGSHSTVKFSKVRCEH